MITKFTFKEMVEGVGGLEQCTPMQTLLTDAQTLASALDAWWAGLVLHKHMNASRRRIERLLDSGYGVRSRTLYRTMKRYASQQRRFQALNQQSCAFTSQLEKYNEEETDDLAE